MKLAGWLVVAFLGVGSISSWAATDDQTAPAQVQSPQPAPQSPVSPHGEDSLRAMKQMGPAMGSMMEGMMSAMLRLYAQPETANSIAAFTRNYYEALVKRGFTEEQALKIVSSHGVPTMGR